MVFASLRSLLAVAGTALALAALAVPALCQDRPVASPAAAVTGAPPERPLPVLIDPAARYLLAVPGTVSKAPDPGEAQRIHAALERQGFRIVHERRATAKTMAAGVKRLVENGVQPGNISVLAMGEGLQTLIDVAQQVYDPMVSYIVVSGCQNPPSFASRVPLKGRFLSVQVEKPEAPNVSCRSVFAGRGAANGFDYEEIRFKPDAQNPAILELVLVEAINAWTRADRGDGYDDVR
ncbi:MAG: hypothetical protein AB7R90_14890 [Reyranellaceae bacterium]